MNKNHDHQDDPTSDEDQIKHVYDDIQEYDKKLPNWWLMTFYATIVFSIGYWFYFHIAEIARTPEERLAQAQARAAAHLAGGAGGFSDEALLAMSRDETVLSSARNAYATSCAACHGANFEGGIGPRLQDADWKHGGLPAQILTSIQEGVPAGGMPPWRTVLGEMRTAELTALLLSLNPVADAESGPTEEAEAGGL